MKKATGTNPVALLLIIGCNKLMRMTFQQAFKAVVVNDYGPVTDGDCIWFLSRVHLDHALARYDHMIDQGGVLAQKVMASPAMFGVRNAMRSSFA